MISSRTIGAAPSLNGWLTIIVFIVASAFSFPSAATNLPYKLHKEQNIDKHQVGWIDLNITASGDATLTAGFSNGAKISGNNFYSVTRLIANDGSVIKALLQVKGLDGSWMGKAREGSVTNRFTLTNDELSRFDHIDLKMGVRNCGIEVIEMHNLNDWTFETKKCDDIPAPVRRNQ